MKRFQMIALVLAMALGLAVAASAQEPGEKITIKRDTKLGTEVLPKMATRAQWSSCRASAKS